jgi:hypothetical protein
MSAIYIKLYNNYLPGPIQKSFGKLTELRSMDVVGATGIDGGDDSVQNGEEGK